MNNFNNLEEKKRRRKRLNVFKYVQEASSGDSFVVAIKDSLEDPSWTYIILKLIIYNL